MRIVSPPYENRIFASSIIFAISILGDEVFMRADRGGGSIIICESSKLIRVWDHKYACASADVLKQDEKYRDAEAGFSLGLNNPVPLANACIGYRDTIGIYHGVTRTIWLLANAVKEFPLHCKTSQSEKIHSLIGKEGVLPKKINDVAPLFDIEKGGYFDLPSCTKNWL